MHPNLVIHNPIVIHFSQQPQHSCRRFLFFLGCCSFSASYLVVHQPCNAETDTCLQPYNPFHFYRVGTLADAFTHKAFACRYFSNNICTVVEEWTHGYLSLGYFFHDTFRHVTRMAQKVWRHCVLFFLRTIITLMPETALVPLRTLAFFLSTGNRYLFLIQRRSIPFDSLTRALDSILPCLASKFRNRIF